MTFRFTDVGFGQLHWSYNGVPQLQASTFLLELMQYNKTMQSACDFNLLEFYSILQLIISIIAHSMMT